MSKYPKLYHGTSFRSLEMTVNFCNAINNVSAEKNGNCA